MEIVTGSTGEAHVTPIDDAVRNSNFGYYAEKIVFDVFRALEAVAVTANEVRVYSGYGMNQGRLFKIDDSDYDSVTIENGTQGVKRADLIVARYTMDSQTGFEDISLAVIKGQSGQAYTDPSFTEGNINEGASLDEFPLYRVKVNGIVIEAVEPLFEATPDGGRLGVLEKRLDGQMLVDLAKSSRNYLDGSENVDLGVKGNLPIANGGTGSSTVAGARNNLGLGNTDGALPVANGGTGKTSFTSGRVLIGNGTEPISEKAIDSAVTAESENLITSGAVAQALEEGGYGDMLKSTYVVSSSVDAIKPSKGGTGKTSWTQGTVLVGNGQSTPTERSIDTTSGGTANSNALITSGAVKSKIAEMQATFQSGVDTIVDAIERNGVTPSASTPSACADGIDDVYTKGKTDAESVTWEQTLNIKAVLLAYSNAPIQFGTQLNCDNMIKLKMTQCVSAVSGVTWEFLNASGAVISNGVFSLNTDVQVPSNAVKLNITASKESTSSVNNSVTFTVTNQAKLIHS